MSYEINIQYRDWEIGHARVLDFPLVQITDVPLTSTLFQHDIVRLTDTSGDLQHPDIDEIVYSRFPRRTRLEFDDYEQVYRLLPHLLLLGGELRFQFHPNQGKRGTLMV